MAVLKHGPSYAVDYDEAAEEGAAEEYRKFADAAVLVKALVHPGGLPPFPRIAINRRVAAARGIPSSVRLEVEPRLGRLAGRGTVLGLATGSTPVGVYDELVRLHREEGVSFRSVVTFNLDEYVGLGPDHPASYRWFMQEHLFGKINIKPEHTRVPDGLARDIPAHCAEYEAAITRAGGIDLQLLGIGRDGQPVFLKDIWPTNQEVADAVKKSVRREHFAKEYGEVFKGDAMWNAIKVPAGDLKYQILDLNR